MVSVHHVVVFDGFDPVLPKVDEISAQLFSFKVSVSGGFLKFSSGPGSY